MTEYIDRQAVNNLLYNVYSREVYTHEGAVQKITGEIDVNELNSIPTADVRENKSGKWIKANPVDCDEETVRVCDNCFGPSLIPFSFCPHCGSEMKWEKNG